MPIRPIARLAGILIDEWTAADGQTARLAERIYFDTPEWEATLEWCRFHGIDPDLVPAGTEIVRNAETHTIRYTRMVMGADGKRQLNPDGTDLLMVAAVEQGEAGPLPFPTDRDEEQL